MKNGDVLCVPWPREVNDREKSPNSMKMTKDGVSTTLGEDASKKMLNAERNLKSRILRGVISFTSCG